MDLFPAIDLQNGKVCRLKKGNFDESVTYPVEPEEAASSFAASGFRFLHVVDLDGARTGTPVHTGIIPKLASAGLPVQYGGGLRDPNQIEQVLDAGAFRAMAGSLLFCTNPGPVELFRRFGEKILPAVDVKAGKVALGGWTGLSTHSPSEALKILAGAGFNSFLVTSAERDGTLSGPDLALYMYLLEIFPRVSLIAAGGIATVDDISELCRIGCSGAVLGRSLYEGTIDPGRALSEASKC